MKKINLFTPFMGLAEAAAVKKTLLSGWVTLGPRTEEFENKFAKYVGAKHAIAVNSATSALHLALIVLDLKKGDEVITPAMTFAATAEVVLYTGATPVFADVQEDTLNIDPKSLEARITKNTKAIIVVHYGGQPCDMDEIERIAKKHNLPIIEDAAHAAGATYGKVRIGGSKNMTCFSFHAVKNLACGDGGMITTDSAEMDKKLRLLRWFGISKSTHERQAAGEYRWDYDIIDGGYKYHMNDITASIGLVQLEKLEKMNARRAEIAKIYDSYFKKKNVAGTPVAQHPGRKTAGHIYCLKLATNIERRPLMNYLAEQLISTGVHYKPLHLHPRYAPFGKGQTPVTDKVWPYMLSLPMHPGLSDVDAHRVAKTILAYAAKLA